MLRVQQSLPLHVCIIVSALRAIRTVFWAATGLYGNKLARLYSIGSVILPVYRLSAKKQIVQRRVVDGIHFRAIPVIPQEILFRLVRR
jgi:hypothetical protein